MKRTAPLALLLVLPLLATSTSGCASDNWVDPVYEIDDEAYVVVYPFDDPDYPNAWDSPLGHDLAQATTAVLSREAEFLVVPYREILDLLIARPAEGGDEDAGALAEFDVRELTPAKLGKATAADYVLVCDVRDYSLRDPRNINMAQATATVEVRLFELARGKAVEEIERENERLRERNKVREELGLEPLGQVSDGGKYVQMNTIDVRYPDSYLEQYGRVFMTPTEARRGLTAAIAKKAAELYYPHIESRIPED